MVSKGTKQEKSPQRSPPKSYRKSPSRAVKSKSPSRLTTNSPLASPKPRRSIRQSPSRNTTSTPKKSPSRRSPARTTSIRIDKYKSNVPDRITRASSKSRQEIESESDDDVSLVVRAESKMRGRPRKMTNEASEPQNIIPKLREPTPEVGGYINLIRRSTTKSFIHEIDHIDHLKRESSTSSIRKLTELSDEDDVLTGDFREKSVHKSEPKLIDKMTPNEFGLLSALLYIFLLPLVPVIFLVYCNDKQCKFTMSPKFNYSLFSTYFGLKSFAITLCYLLLIFVIGGLPFGGQKVAGLPNRGSKLNYVLNGFFTAVLVGVVLILLETFTGVLVIENVLQNFFQYYVAFTILGVILSVALYIRSFYVPLCGLKSDALINSGIYNFYHGREINPRVFGIFDVKLSLQRTYFISLIIMNAILVYKSITYKVLTDGDIDYKSIKYSETLAVFAAMQITQSGLCLLFEADYVTSFLGQYEALGYELTLVLLLGPTFGMGASKYVFDYGVTLPRLHLVLAAILFMVGNVIYHRSNWQKRQFRLNPYHPKISHLESIPTSQGRKLLVSGYWGMVRHPSYLGYVMMQLSFCVLLYNALPVLVFLFDIFWSVSHASQTELKCEQRYGSAWKRYCQRVKYFLIPKVY